MCCDDDVVVVLFEIFSVCRVKTKKSNEIKKTNANEKAHTNKKTTFLCAALAQQNKRESKTHAMLRRTAPCQNLLRKTPVRAYKYQQFEMSKDAQFLFYYPREAPNTSYFHHFFLGTWTWFGMGREDVWIDNADRRYMTTWQRLRQYAMWFFPLMYIFPLGSWPLYAKELYGEYGWKSFLNEKQPLDQLYIEWGWQSVDAEYIRHIHSRDTY